MAGKHFEVYREKKLSVEWLHFTIIVMPHLPGDVDNTTSPETEVSLEGSFQSYWRYSQMKM